jgi:hypothetical protein
VIKLLYNLFAEDLQLNMDTPQIDDILIVAGQISAAIIAISGAIAILYRIFFKKMCDSIEKINKELHPNHGTSLRDAIDRIADTQDDLKLEVGKIREKVDDHIVWHLDQ